MNATAQQWMICYMNPAAWGGPSLTAEFVDSDSEAGARQAFARLHPGRTISTMMGMFHDEA